MKLDNNLSGIFATSKYPLVYLNMPKCACTTIKNIMYYLDHDSLYSPPEDIHRAIINKSALISKHNSPQKLKETLKNKKIAFTLVRNPLSRAYSCFNEKIFFRTPNSFLNIRNWLCAHYHLNLPKDPLNLSDQDYGINEHQNNFKKFLLFVHDNVKGKTSIRIDAHWRPQKEMINLYSNVTSIDLIGRVEHFREDMKYVFTRLGISEVRLLNLKFNEGPPAPYSLKKLIDDEMFDLVAKAYGIDYHWFGYTLV